LSVFRGGTGEFNADLQLQFPISSGESVLVYSASALERGEYGADSVLPFGTVGPALAYVTTFDMVFAQ